MYNIDFKLVLFLLHTQVRVRLPGRSMTSGEHNILTLNGTSIDVIYSLASSASTFSAEGRFIKQNVDHLRTVVV